MSVVALLGLPNSGKSTLFNHLTQSRQRVANFPGITVEKKMGYFNFESEKLSVVDLPGVYTLDVSTLDEKITRDYIFNKIQDDAADVFVLVVDATNLKKSIYLATQLMDIGQKFVVALNMMDIAKERGQELDLNKLSNHLGGATIIPIVATDGTGVENLLKAVTEEKKKEINSLDLPKDLQKQIKDPAYIKNKFSLIQSIMKDITVKEIKHDNFTEKVDSIVLHPFLGPIILLSTLVLIFQLLFAWSDPFMGWIELGFEGLANLVTSIVPEGLFQSMLVDGVIVGVGGILVFLPHIVFLFIIIYFLEDFGYLGRAAFLLDTIMRKVGLPGKSVVPLLSSHACAIPGIMSARIIESPIQRLVVMMISPLATCSARLPVYTLLIGVIIPEDKIYFGVLGLQGLVLFSLYFFGMLSAFIISFIAKKTFAPTSPSYLLMELPPYRMPKIKNVLRGAFQKGWIFVKKAGTVILLLSIVIWALTTFPRTENLELGKLEAPPIVESYAGSIGKTFQPIFAPLGFDWKITTALIPSFAAREVMVSAMATVHAVEGDDTEDEGFLGQLSGILSNNYSLATLLSLMVWFIFAPQCIATFGVMKKETGGYKMPFIFGAYTLALAYIMALITYLIFS